MNEGLRKLNALPEDAAFRELQMCCGAPKWASHMAKARPFNSPEAAYLAAEEAFDALGPDDWMTAFAAHPRLGQKKSEKQNETANAWSASEQAGVKSADDESKTELATLNDEYYERHGFTFILCASGKSAAEMVFALKARLPNTPQDEQRLAAVEQRKITRLRLERLILS